VAQRLIETSCMSLSLPDSPPAAAATPRRLFAEPGVVARGWYAVARSARLDAGRVLGGDLGPRRLAVWRDRLGRPHACDARCPHLGADLSQGEVVESGLRCALHHWTFDGAGRCVAAPGCGSPPDRQTISLPVVERLGLVWAWAGPIALADPPAFPDGDAEQRFVRLLAPPRRLACHSHLIVANGLDASHFEALHGMRLERPPALESPGGFPLALTLEGRPRSPRLQRLTGTRQRPFRARFVALGPAVAWSTVESPFAFHTLYTARPLAAGGSETQLALFLPRRPLLAARALLLMALLLHRDRQILETLRFHRGFVPRDEALARFAAIVDGLEAFE
jgi:aminopyrrolnitrin oxygenase